MKETVMEEKITKKYKVRKFKTERKKYKYGRKVWKEEEGKMKREKEK